MLGVAVAQNIHIEPLKIAKNKANSLTGWSMEEKIWDEIKKQR